MDTSKDWCTTIEENTYDDIVFASEVTKKPKKGKIVFYGRSGGSWGGRKPNVKAPVKKTNKRSTMKFRVSNSKSRVILK